MPEGFCLEAPKFLFLEQKLTHCSLLFSEMHAIAHAQAGTYISKFTYAVLIFSLFVLLLLYISHKEKFFVDRFFIEHYIQEI